MTRNPALIREHVLIRTDSNWGPPMTYAANLGRDRIIKLLHGMGAKDLESAAGRAALQGKADTVVCAGAGQGAPASDGASRGAGAPDDQNEARFTRLLLDRGANPNVRASLRQRLEEGHGGGPLREYRDVTPVAWGEGFADKIFVSRESLRLIQARGGGR